MIMTMIKFMSTKTVKMKMTKMTMEASPQSFISYPSLDVHGSYQPHIGNGAILDCQRRQTVFPPLLAQHLQGRIGHGIVGLTDVAPAAGQRREHDEVIQLGTQFARSLVQVLG